MKINLDSMQGNQKGKTVSLANGVQMPLIGLGVYKSKEGAEVENAVLSALENGYRLIDTASFYGNEAGVGRAVHTSGMDRDTIFISTKLWNSDQGYHNAIEAFNRSLDKLKMDYVDLYLVHWPVENKYLETWPAIEEIYKTGRAKAIGVSNFYVHHLEKLKAVASISPMVNQVEFHPFLQQKPLQDYCRSNKIQYESWSPIMRGRVLEIELLKKLAIKYDKSAVQIVIRWNYQKSIVCIPKSVKPARIKSNIDIFDFEIDESDMLLIDQLDRNERTGPDPDNFDF